MSRCRGPIPKMTHLHAFLQNELFFCNGLDNGTGLTILYLFCVTPMVTQNIELQNRVMLYLQLLASFKCAFLAVKCILIHVIPMLDVVFKLLPNMQHISDASVTAVNVKFPLIRGWERWNRV